MNVAISYNLSDDDFILLLLKFSTSALKPMNSPGTYPVLFEEITAVMGPDLHHKQHSFLSFVSWPSIYNISYFFIDGGIEIELLKKKKKVVDSKKNFDNE